MKKSTTRKTREAPAKKREKAQREKSSVKRATKAATRADKAPRKPSKGKKARKGRKAASGGGKALGDFTNSQKLRVLKPKEISRKACFKTGQTVAANLALQKAKGFRGRRKYLRTQIANERVSLR